MFSRIFTSAVVALGIFLSSVSHAQNAYAADVHTDYGLIDDVVVFDRPVPWPWGLEQPFPWPDIQGIWKVVDADFTSYFALKVVRVKATGERQLIVRQIDADSCKVVATGVGYDLQRVVRAQMTSVQSGVAYRIALRAFSEKDSPKPAMGKLVTSQIVVLSLMDVDAKPESQPVHFQLGKISSTLDMKTCAAEKNKVF